MMVSEFPKIWERHDIWSDCALYTLWWTTQAKKMISVWFTWINAKPIVSGCDESAVAVAVRPSKALAESKMLIKASSQELITLRVQYLVDRDPFTSVSMFPIPTRAPSYSFISTEPLATQLPSVLRLLNAPHRVRKLNKEFLGYFGGGLFYTLFQFMTCLPHKQIAVLCDYVDLKQIALAGKESHS